MIIKRQAERSFGQWLASFHVNGYQWHCVVWHKFTDVSEEPADLSHGEQDRVARRYISTRLHDVTHLTTLISILIDIKICSMVSDNDVFQPNSPKHSFFSLIHITWMSLLNYQDLTAVAILAKTAELSCQTTLTTKYCECRLTNWTYFMKPSV